MTSSSSSSSSTNFIATQVLNKTSGPLCVNATVAGSVRCHMIYGTVPSSVHAWMPPVTWSPAAACSRLLQRQRGRHDRRWSCATTVEHDGDDADRRRIWHKHMTDINMQLWKTGTLSLALTSINTVSCLSQQSSWNCSKSQLNKIHSCLIRSIFQQTVSKASTLSCKTSTITVNGYKS